MTLVGGGIAVPPLSAQTASFAVEEITVTARKREESLRDVPVAVTAVTGAAVEARGIENVTGMIGTVPSLFTTQNQTFGPMPNQTYLVMRGVGATSANDPAVATFVDGVYQPSLGFDIGFLDLERVEILRGPQGALFGRNTQGGAVNIVTRLPSSEVEGRVMAEYAEFNSWRLGASVAGPVQEDKIFIRLSGMYASTDGYLENITLNQDADTSEDITGRLTLRMLASERLEIILRAEGASREYGYLGFGVPDDGSKRYVVLDDQAPDSEDDSYGLSLTVNYDFDSATLTSITGYNKIETDYWYDLDSSADIGNFQQQLTDQRLFSEELRLASTGDGAIEWLAGLYYFDQVHDQSRDFSAGECSVCVFPPVFSTDNVVLEQTRFDRDGWAAFGQAGYSPVDQVDLTVGARYSREKIRANQAGRIFVPGVGADESFAGVNDETFSNFSPMASISYRLNDDIMTYITVSRGYKTGGYDKYPGTGGAVGIPFDEETSTNYEIGMKSSFFERRLTLDLATFYVDIDDMQLASTVISPITNLPVGVTTNVGSAKSEGFEFEFATAPIEGLLLRGNGAYVKSVFKRLDSPVGVNEVGGRVPYVPKWTLSGSAEYSHPLANGEWEMTWGLFYRYVGSHETGNGVPPFDPRLEIESYDVLDASITVTNENWDFSVFANNLTDSFNIERRFQPLFQPYTRANVMPPRQFGFRVTYNW